MCNLHAAGTAAMMEAALEGLTRADGMRPLLIAVTQLTSTDQERMEKDLLIEKPLEEVVDHYAANAKKAGLDGVVCSPLEAARVHELCGRRLPDGNTGCALCGRRCRRPGARDDTRSAQRKSAQTISWSVVRLRRQKTLWRPTDAASASLSAELAEAV